MKEFMRTRWLGIISAIIAFVVIILSSFTTPVESDYERCERIENETIERILNTKGEGINKYLVRRGNDGRIEVTIWAQRGIGVREYHLQQHTWLDSYGKNIETVTYKENLVICMPIIDFDT